MDSRKNATPLPPIELLREYFVYDPETGEIKDRVKRGNCSYPGRLNNCWSRAGGYGLVAVKGKQYKAHRIAWALHTGEDPGPMMVDHINGDPSDNRACNLRLADEYVNSQNARLRGSASGVRGVQWKPLSKKWAARISVDGVLRHIGLFESIEDAEAAYQRAREKYHKGYVNRAA